MTAGDARLDAIQAKFQRALSTLAWPETPEERDAAEKELTADVAFLLAELREAREALTRVEGLAERAESHGNLYVFVDDLTSAVAAANGDGRG